MIVIASVVSAGYRSPVEQQLSSVSVENATVNTKEDSRDIALINQAQAADLAASAASVANLSVANNVSSKSISLNTKEELAQSDDTVISKPQIAQTLIATEAITSYQTVEGDTATSIAEKFGISDQTVRWANNLKDDKVAVGSTLAIPSIDGVVYTVKDNDSLEAIANKYQSDAKSIVTINDLEISGLTAGAQIVLPGATLPENERPGYSAPVSRSSNSSSVTVRSGRDVTAMVGNRYSYGYCTWYAYNRRAQLGRPIGSLWGNATTWAANARAAGFSVNNVPEVGAVFQTSGGWGGYGHVGVVESINPDGSITISEMNYAGWNVVNTRTIPNPGAYNYIH